MNISLSLIKYVVLSLKLYNNVMVLKSKILMVIHVYSFNTKR